MKFELNEYYRNISDKELLEDLQKVAKQIGKMELTQKEYLTHGKYHNSTICKRFNGWNNALDKAGLLHAKEYVRKNIKISNMELIEDLTNTAAQLKQETITTSQYNKNGHYGSSIIILRFNSWENALKRAGLQPTGFHHVITEEEFFSDIEHIWIMLGRQPTTTDIRNGISDYSLSSYSSHFGSWRRALQAFIEWINSDNREQQSGKEERSIVEETKTSVIQDTSFTHRHTTKREVNLRLRFKVMQRDNFKCCLCGASPAKDPSVELHIDHIKPWSKGGETTIDNLRTLCSKCNLGKSDLYDE